MAKIYRQPFVMNTFLAAAADIVTTSPGWLSLTGMNNMMYIPGGYGRVLGSLVETPNVVLYTPTITAGATNSFIITQKNLATGQMQNYIWADTVAATGDTATTITTRLKNWINSMNSGGNTLYVTVAGTTTATITGGTGNPIFTFSNLGTGTMAAVAPLTGTGIAIVSSTNATPIVVTTGASTYTVGMTVTIANHATNTAANGTWRVSATNGTTTVTLEGSVGNGVGGATGTLSTLPQYARGTSALVTAAGTTAVPLGGTTPIAGDTYSTLVYNGYYPDSDRTTEEVHSGYQQIIYFDEAGSNYAAFLAQLNLELQRQVSAGVADPDLVS